MRKLITAGLFLLLPLPLAAQQTGQKELTHADSSYVQVYSHDFVGGTQEFVRVKLLKDRMYRAELNQGGVNLEIQPLDQSVQQPYLARTLPGQSVTGGTMFDLRPYATAIYQISVLDVPSGAATFRLLEKKPVAKGEAAKETGTAEVKDRAR